MQPDGRPGEPNPARIGRGHAREHVDDRALARAVLAHEREHLAGVDREVEALDGRHRAIALGEAVEVEHGSGHQGRSATRPARMSSISASMLAFSSAESAFSNLPRKGARPMPPSFSPST